MIKKSLNILIINFDWRNIFETGFDEFYKKMERDCLNPDFNNFFFYSWAKVSYYKKKDQYVSVHQKVYGKFFKPFVDLLSIWLVPRAIKKYGFKPDIVFVYDLGHIQTALVIKRLYGSKIVYCCTNMPKEYSATRRWGYFKSLYSSWLEKFFLKKIDLAYTINDTMKNFLFGLGLPAEKIVIFASNTIFRDKKHIDASERGRIKNKLGLKPDQKIILSIGRLETEKDHPRLLQLFSQLSNDYCLIILGQGSLLSELQKLTRELDIANRVFFEGFVHREKIWDYYNDADVFVLLSKVEALGLVFWEAMYMGVPVIGSVAPGIVETIGTDGERGFILKDDEGIDLFKEKIDFCVGVSEEKKSMLERSRKYVDLQISNNVNINKLIV